MKRQAKVPDPWKMPITGYAEVDPSTLIPSPLNWRGHPQGQQDALLGLLRSVGFVQNILVSQRTGAILDGHLRVELALQEHQRTVPVTYIDVSEEEERLILTTFDPIATLAAKNQDALSRLSVGLQSEHTALQQFLATLAPAPTEPLVTWHVLPPTETGYRPNLTPETPAPHEVTTTQMAQAEASQHALIHQERALKPVCCPQCGADFFVDLHE